jgi:hypothetical protein
MLGLLIDPAALMCVKLCVYIAKTGDNPEIPKSRPDPTDYRAFFVLLFCEGDQVRGEMRLLLKIPSYKYLLL